MDLINQHMVMPRDLNPANHIFGGQILAWLDEAAGLYVINQIHYANIVTYKMENVHFKSPAHNGDHVSFFAEIVEKINSRVVVRVKAVAKNPTTGDEREVITCLVTFVCLDEKGKPLALFRQSAP